MAGATASSVENVKAQAASSRGFVAGRWTASFIGALLILAGCDPVYRTHALVERDDVVQLLVYENRYDQKRMAVVNGEPAKQLVACMKVERQENPFYDPFGRVVGACTCKPYAFAYVDCADGTVIPLSFVMNGFDVKGGYGTLEPPFQALYDGLPWLDYRPAATRPASPPATTAR